MSIEIENEQCNDEMNKTSSTRKKCEVYVYCTKKTNNNDELIDDNFIMECYQKKNVLKI